MKTMAALAAAAVLVGCATRTEGPSKALGLGAYSPVTLAPLKVEWVDVASGDEAALRRMEGHLIKCLTGHLPIVRQQTAASEGLLIEPIIVSLRTGDAAARGISAVADGASVLLKVRYTDAATGAVVAEPAFYSRGPAMGGAWTSGEADTAMLRRVVTEACDYVRKNR
ncbi:MAG: hypothetical protein ACM33T_03410 [Solirubrobacterales bacterium]